MLLPFQPNIPEQTLASAVCVCQYIMTMNILKAKWSLLCNIRHFEDEAEFWVNSNTLHIIIQLLGIRMSFFTLL